MRASLKAVIVLAALALPGLAVAQASQDDEILKKSSSGGTETAPPPVEDEELSTTYSSIGLQKVHAKFDNVKDAINLDLVAFGFRIPTVQWFAVELNIGFTMIPGQIDQGGGSGGSGGNCVSLNPNLPLGCTPPSPGSAASSAGDFQATNLGAYAVLRSPGTIFAMGKYGYRYLSTSIDELQNDRSGTAYGAGIGYRWNKKGSYVELGYTHLSDKISGIGFSISYSYNRR